MKHLAAFVLCGIVFIATTAKAQDRIDLFSDQAGTQCSLIDDGGLKAVYVFVSGPNGAIAIQFAAPRPACWLGATWVGDGFPGPRGPIGNTQTGIQLPLFAPGIGECKTPPVLACIMYFVTTGASQPCCDLVVLPTTSYPIEPYGLEYLDCSFGVHPALAGHKVVINPDASCPCQLPVATEPTSWGRVKALYR